MRLTCIVFATVLAACDVDAPSASTNGETQGRLGKALLSATSPVAVLAGDSTNFIGPVVEADAAHPPASDGRDLSDEDVHTSDLDPGLQLARAAAAQAESRVIYDPAYVRLDYPLGDVPADRGVCSDVVVRAYRALGVDLQVRVHEDMTAAFAAYPRLWALTGPDRNIDHRRVPNLEAFWTRAGARLPAATEVDQLKPGDLVTYRLDDRLPHVAIVSDRRGASGRFMIVHNIGAGVQVEDAIDAWPITGLFRWRPSTLAPAD